MLFEKVQKEHILQGIRDFEEKGMPIGFGPSSTYDLIYGGKAYPPKAIMAYANYNASGREIESYFKGGQGTDCFNKYDEFGFIIKEKARYEQVFQVLLEKYKIIIANEGFKNEIYKWELLEKYQGRPDTSAENFIEEIKSIDFSNLLYHNARGVALHIVKEKPEEYRTQYKLLFDESIPLQERIELFSTEIEASYRNLDGAKDFSHHHDERTIATLLTYHNPEKYTFYKSSFYKKLCKQLDIKPKKAGKKYVHYLSLVHEFVNGHLKKDIDLLKKVSENVSQDFYRDPNHLLLAQDILYRTLEVDNSTTNSNSTKNYKVQFNSWLNANTKADTGTRTSYIKAIELLEEPLGYDIFTKDELAVLNNLYQKLKKDQRNKDGIFYNEKAPSYGKNGFYSAAVKKYIEFLSSCNKNNDEAEFIDVLKKLEYIEVAKYFSFLDIVTTKLSLVINDERYVTGLSKQQLNLTIGQRYCWNLYAKRRKRRFGVISTEKINETSEPFQSARPEAFYTYSQDHKLAFDNQVIVIAAIKNELERTNKSGFEKHNNRAFEKAMFNVQYRKEIFDRVFDNFKTTIFSEFSVYLSKQEKINQSKQDVYLESVTKMIPEIWFKEFKSNFDIEDLSEINLQKIHRLSKKNYDNTFKGKLFFQDFILGMLDSFKENTNMKIAINQILYGPPGTGKTFYLKNQLFDKYTSKETSISLEQHFETVVSGCSWWQVIAIALIEMGNSNVSEIFENKWVKKKASLSNSRTVRPTIWGQLQSHTIYECEFVNVSNRQQPLIFNKTKDSFWEILEDQVEILVPELYEIKDSVDNYSPNPDKIIKHYEFVTFHQSFAYEDFIEGIKPILPENGEESKDLGYVIENGVFKNLCLKAKNDPDNRYAIFIDEINRGNVSAIFGELITLIELDKRKGTKNEIAIKLPYSKKPFSVPSNIDIYGTMNTADRSVEALDTALRRRFEFKEMMPNVQVIDDEVVDGISLSEILKTINERIELLIDRDHTIGHSYFINVATKEALANAFNNKIVPLLQEYFYGDYGKIGLVLGQGFVEKLKNDHINFASFNYDNANDFKTPTFILKRVTSDSIIDAVNILLAKKEIIQNQ